MKIPAHFLENASGTRYAYEGQRGYLQLVADILMHGSTPPDRTGTGRRKLFSRQVRFDLRKSFPLLTMRPVFCESAFKELWSFFNGVLMIAPTLQAQGVSFWNDHTSRAFLDGRNLQHLPEGHIGKAYSFQFRNFGGELTPDFKAVGGTDQLQRVFDNIKNKPFDSRHLVSIWNPDQEDEMPLPPCCWNHQFLVTLDDDGNKVLNIQLSARSSDLIFGGAYNLPQYALWLLAMSHAQGMIAGEIVFVPTDVHIYGYPSDIPASELDGWPAHIVEQLHARVDSAPDADREVPAASQMLYALEVLGRDFDETPIRVTINKPLNSLEDILAMKFSDFEFSQDHKVNRSPFKTPRPKMAV